MKAKKTSQTARELRIEYIPLAELKKWPRNPKLHDLPMLTKSFARFGFINPIILNEANGELLAGHGRLDTLLEAKAKKKPLPDGVKSSNGDWLVPVVRGVSLEGKEAEAYAIADNRLVEIGGWDDNLLAEILQGLDLDGIGYSQADLDGLLANLVEPKAGLTDDDEIPEKVETVCKTGDLWQLDNHRLLCGDATCREDVEKLMGGEKADMVFTDPPYGVDYEGGSNNPKKRQKLRGDDTDIYSAFMPFLPISNDLAMYIWFAERAGKPVFNALLDNCWQIRAMVVWVKLGAHYGAFTAHYKQQHEAMLYCVRGRPIWNGATNETTIWEYPQPSRNELHPTQKPIELCRHAISNSSNQGSIVVDLFGGSGSTLIACEKLGRKCRMMEISEMYCSVIIKRWENYTGNKALKLCLTSF